MGKLFLQKFASGLCRYPADQNFVEIALSCTFFGDKRIFTFYTEIQDGHQKWQENEFLRKVTSRFVKITLSCSISEIDDILR